MSDQHRQINDLMAAGYSRREARHLVDDGRLTKGKFQEARRQGIAKQNRTKKAQARAKAEADRSARRSFGSRLFRLNRREW